MRGDRPTTTRAARVLELAVALLSVGVVVGAAALVRPADVVAGAVLVAALAIAAAPFVVVALTSAPAPAPPEVEWVPDRPDRLPAVTTVIRVGGEPLDLVIACGAIATRSGPTVLVTAGRPELDDVAQALGVPLVRDVAIETALHRASWLVETEAVLVVQPGAVPLADGCARAAARLTDGVDWVIGSVRSFDHGYAPEGREELGAHLRRRARHAGLVVWERDATIVRTALLRETAMAPRRPWGGWLRSVRAHGAAGAEEPGAVALRTAPAGASVFWPATVSHQRAAAADLSDALASGGARSRLVAAGLLLRELYAYPLAILLATPFVVGLAGSFPFRGAPAALVGIALGAGAARWLALRVANRAPLHPLGDVVGAAYDAPGSARALFAACSRRLAPTRVRVSQRTLVWATLLLAATAVVPLLDRRAGDPDLEVAAGLAVWVLVLLWLFVLRLVAARNWSRVAPRAVARVPVVVAGTTGHTVDVGPAGLAVALDGPGPEIGTTVTVRLELADEIFTGSARVANRRVVGTREIVGLAVASDVEQRVRWARAAFSAARLDEPGAVAAGPSAARARPVSPDSTSRVVRVLDRTALAVAGVLAVFALTALSLAVAGYRPLAVRSGSMAPTLLTGDLIVVDEIHADEVRVGDIVTFTAVDGDEVTHRVRALDREDDRIRFETRGDANATSEAWSRRPDDVVGRYELRVPQAGRYVAWLRGPDARWAFLGLAGALVTAALLRGLVVTRSGVSRPR